MKDDSTCLAHIQEAVQTIQDYFGVNTKVVWDTYKNDLPSLKSFLAGILGR